MICVDIAKRTRAVMTSDHILCVAVLYANLKDGFITSLLSPTFDTTGSVSVHEVFSSSVNMNEVQVVESL